MSGIRQGAREIIGRIPTHLIATTSPLGARGELSHVYLVFDDGFHYEFYTPARLGWPHGDRAQRRAAASILGKPLERVELYEDCRDIDERDDWAGAGLILVARDGCSCQFVTSLAFYTTSRLWPGGALGALSVFPDDVVLLHVRRRLERAEPVLPAGIERREG